MFPEIEETQLSLLWWSERPVVLLQRELKYWKTGCDELAEGRRSCDLTHSISHQDGWMEGDNMTEHSTLNITPLWCVVTSKLLWELLELEQTVLKLYNQTGPAPEGFYIMKVYSVKWKLIWILQIIHYKATYIYLHDIAKIRSILS